MQISRRKQGRRSCTVETQSRFERSGRAVRAWNARSLRKASMNRIRVNVLPALIFRSKVMASRRRGM